MFGFVLELVLEAPLEQVDPFVQAEPLVSSRGDWRRPATHRLCLT